MRLEGYLGRFNFMVDIFGLLVFFDIIEESGASVIVFLRHYIDVVDVFNILCAHTVKHWLMPI